jgi:hypothetical protein
MPPEGSQAAKNSRIAHFKRRRSRRTPFYQFLYDPFVLFVIIY